MAAMALCFQPWVRHLTGTRIRGVGGHVVRSYERATSVPPPTVVTTAWGGRFHVDFASELEWHLFAFGHYEGHVREAMIERLSQGATCVDVGANVGIHAVALAQHVGPAGSVIAVEPLPDLADRLGDNLTLNGLRNVQVVRAAATAIAGEAVTLRTTATHNRAQASLLPLEHLDGETVRAQTTTVDALGAENVALVKIDVEGAEWDVLRGAERTLDRDHPTVVFEFNRDYSPVPFTTFREFLSDLGYNTITELTHPHGRFRLSTSAVPIGRGDKPHEENATLITAGTRTRTGGIQARRAESGGC